MLFKHEYPYLNFHELNLEWLLKRVHQLTHEMYDFKSINAIEYGGDWTPDKPYKKNTVVVYNGTGYLALKAVPAGIPVDNNEYWISIGAVTPDSLGLVEEVAEIKSDIETINDSIDDLSDEIAAGFPHDNATYHQNIYVDCVNGDDNNDGSYGHSVKTMDRAMQIMNRTASGVYIRMVSGGIYTLSYPVISGAMIHFMYTVPDITLYWLPENDKGWSKCFYSCYINMHGYSKNNSVLYIRGTDDPENTKPAYIEGGKITISNLTIKSDPYTAFGVIGAAIQSSNNIWKSHIYLGLSQGVFSSDSFQTDSLYHTSCLHIYNSSDVSLRGGVSFDNIDNNAHITNIISITSATLRVSQDFIGANTTLANKRIYGATAQFLGGENRLITWLTTCNLDRSMINGDYFSSTTVYPT